VLTSIADPHSIGYLDERAFANGIILALSKRVRLRDAKVINCHIFHHTHTHTHIEALYICGCEPSSPSLSISLTTHTQSSLYWRRYSDSLLAVTAGAAFLVCYTVSHHDWFCKDDGNKKEQCNGEVLLLWIMVFLAVLLLVDLIHEVINFRVYSFSHVTYHKLNCIF
jgi:hypothetical protein